METSDGFMWSRSTADASHCPCVFDRTSIRVRRQLARDIAIVVDRCPTTFEHRNRVRTTTIVDGHTRTIRRVGRHQGIRSQTNHSCSSQLPDISQLMASGRNGASKLRRWGLDRRAETLVAKVVGRSKSHDSSQCFHLACVNPSDKLAFTG